MTTVPETVDYEKKKLKLRSEWKQELKWLEGRNVLYVHQKFPQHAKKSTVSRFSSETMPSGNIFHGKNGQHMPQITKGMLSCL